MERSRTEGESGRRSRRWKIALVAVAGLLATALFFWYVIVPYPWTLRTHNPDRTALMQQRIDEARAAGDSLPIHHGWVELDSISPNLVRAVIVAEDYRFREHDGVDWVSLAEEVQWSGDEEFSWTSLDDLRALREAVAYVRAHRDEVRGRSTITQQLAKNLYFGTDRSFLRKAVELVAAGRLERRLSKDRILELYLNVVEWGPGIFGAEAAARHYFGRSAASLTLDQAAALAGTLPHPLTSNPSHRPGRMLWRKELILGRLDPDGAMPTAPMPLPEPDFEPPSLDRILEIPAPGLVEPVGRVPDAADSAAIDTAAAGDSAAIPPDTTSADTAGTPPDTAGAAIDTTVASGRAGNTPSPDPEAPDYMMIR